MPDIAGGRSPFILALIPARGGSKGVPGKNLASIAGRPMIAYSVDAARGSRRVSECIVSTDSEDIARAAEAAGGRAPFRRPAGLATDEAPTVDVAIHAIEWVEAARGRRVDVLVLLQPTAPLRTSADVDAALDLFLATPGATSLISVCDAAFAHPRLLYVADGRWLEPRERSPGPVRRQSFEPVYLRNGAIYIATRDLVVGARALTDTRPLAYVMPRERSVNVDDPFDLAVARALLAPRDPR